MSVIDNSDCDGFDDDRVMTVVVTVMSVIDGGDCDDGSDRSNYHEDCKFDDDRDYDACA
jgi:hypothetical protein